MLTEGLDADAWRRMLTSREFGTSSTDLHKTFAQLLKKCCIEELESTTLLEASLIACRLIPFNKKPGLQPVGVGEFLRRIAGKIIMKIFKKDITDADEAGAEATINAMREIFSNKDIEAVLLIDAENAFNSIN